MSFKPGWQRSVYFRKNIMFGEGCEGINYSDKEKVIDSEDWIELESFLLRRKVVGDLESH